VVQVLPFPPDVDGNFALPPALAGERSALRCEFPILEFDPSPVALIEPTGVLQPIDIAEHCVLCFFQDVITALQDAGRLTLKWRLGSERGENPVYEMEVNGQRLAICHPGVGAPLAGGFLDELIALGCRKFIACGGAGALDNELVLGHLVVPTRAVRDEGTSYHYLPPAREVAASPTAIAAIERVLQRDNVPYVTGKTWTTDGIYRETAAKIRLRRAEGCLTVEMEAAAFFAVAAFRGVTFGQILYSGDDLSSETWDSRYWQRETSVREKLFWLAAEACLEL
jgi:uridine phosphorylase